MPTTSPGPIAKAASVVVVTWNGAALLPECLDSLLEQETPGWHVEVIVVDNGSSDDTLSVLRHHYEQVRVIPLPQNGGFAAGANRGIEASAAPFVVLVNNDAVCMPGFVAAILAPFEKADADRLGALTARVVLAEHYRPLERQDAPDRTDRTLVGFDGRRWVPTDTTDPRGVQLLNSTGNQVTRTGNGRDRDWLSPSDAFVAASDVFGFCGGAAALRRAALDDIGPFDERLFLYYEDTDLSWRLRRGGWRVQYVPDAIVAHRHAASSGTHSEFFGSQNDRNRLVVALRNAPLPVVLRSIAHTAGRAARDILRGQNVHRHWRTARYIATQLPRLLRERSELARRATVSHRQLAHYLVGDHARRSEVASTKP